ncbi:MAG: tetratricopeptide repeat protein [Planctomycetes bacterium]|nr:tetratricopeptide repeat protein [Planctomycetota bacterium]
MIAADEVIVHDRLDAVAIALDRGDLQRAEALIDDYRRHEGPDARCFRLEGRLRLLGGRHEEARRLLERARAIEPESVELCRMLARLHLERALPS